MGKKKDKITQGFDALLAALDQEMSEVDYLSGIYDETSQKLEELDDEERHVMELLEQESPASLLKAQTLLGSLLKDPQKE